MPPRIAIFTDLTFQKAGAGAPTALQDLPRLFFELTKGGPHEQPDARGADAPFIGTDGQWATPRRRNCLPLELEGWVAGEGATELLQRAAAAVARRAIRDLFWPSAGIGTLTCQDEDGTAWTIDAQPERLKWDENPPAPTHWPGRVELLACGPLWSIPLAAEGSLGTACSNSGSNLESGYPPWGGDGEERVEIAVAEAVPAGNTIIVAAASRGAEGAFERQVYDQRGNAWVLDAQHAHAGNEYRALIWRCYVTNALSAGDWIRFAHRSDTLGVGVDTASRCLGAGHFRGMPADPTVTVGAGASGFSSTPALSTPAGQVVAAAIALEENTQVTGLTMDGDWTTFAPFTLVSGGSPNTTEGIGGQYLLNAGASTWNATIDQTRVWAAISVGYSW